MPGERSARRLQGVAMRTTAFMPLRFFAPTPIFYVSLSTSSLSQIYISSKNHHYHSLNASWQRSISERSVSASSPTGPRPLGDPPPLAPLWGPAIEFLAKVRTDVFFDKRLDCYKHQTSQLTYF